MYQLTNNPEFVTDLDTGACVPTDGDSYQSRVYVEWLAEGNTPQPAPGPSKDAAWADRSASVQNWLDTTAKENEYDNAERCISYAGSTNETYAADAKAMSAWRDALWPAFYAMSANWPTDPAQWPLWDAIQPLLPQPADFGWAIHAPVGTPTTV